VLRDEEVVALQLASCGARRILQTMNDETIGAAFEAMIPPALRLLDFQQLVGLSLDEARQRVEAAGGMFRAIGVDKHQGLPTAITTDLRLDRVTVVIAANRVVETHGIG
jgi:hypothetical protein